MSQAKSEFQSVTSEAYRRRMSSVVKGKLERPVVVGYSSMTVSINLQRHKFQCLEVQ